MSRSFRLLFAAVVSMAGCNLAYSQDAQPASPVNAATASSDTISSLKAENAALKKEVTDAAKTITDLQSKLAQEKTQLDSANADLAAAKAQPAPAPAAAAPVAGAVTADTAAPAGPMKALPLDATNVVTTPGAPGAPAAGGGASRSYTVVKGDSLWKIAHKMYPGDTKNGVDKIQDANKDAIGGKPLKIGQVLVIPQ